MVKTLFFIVLIGFWGVAFSGCGVKTNPIPYVEAYPNEGNKVSPPSNVPGETREGISAPVKSSTEPN